MKTTIDLPADLLERANVVATLRRTTLNELVVSGLEVVLPPHKSNATGNEDLIEALSKGHNTEPVGRLQRDEIYDRAVLRGH